MIVSLCRGALAPRHMRTITHSTTAGRGGIAPPRPPEAANYGGSLSSCHLQTRTTLRRRITSLRSRSRPTRVDKFKSKRAATSYGVDNLVDGCLIRRLENSQGLLPPPPGRGRVLVGRIVLRHGSGERLERNSLHLIAEDLAVEYLPSGKVLRFRLALGSKPYDVFFLAHVPSQNLRQHVELYGVAGLRASEDLVGLKPSAARTKVSLSTRSTRRAIEEGVP